VLRVLRLEITMLLRERRLLAALAAATLVLTIAGAVSLTSAQRARLARAEVGANERQR